MEQDTKINAIKSKRLLLEYGDQIDEAIKKAVENALLQHKRAWNAVAVWRDERVVMLQPEEIILEEK